MGKVILSASGKGGVGKSIFTANLGATLAERGLKIVMIDMNVGLRNLDIYMGLENKVIYDVADVLSGVCRPGKAMVRDKRFPSLYVMPATQKKEKFDASHSDVARLYAGLKENYDFILVDGPAGVTKELSLAAAGADLGLIITTLEYVSLRDADMADSLLVESGLRKRAYVLNKVDRALLRTGILPTFEDVSFIMKPPLLGIIQNDVNIHLSANCGIPIVCQKGNYIEENFNRIADRIIGY
ncbi:MAG: septum site-determining protein MinD [Clostridiales Family XIII bacterium]|jgi:septum site-determining protein MinD|nr:septum site-determining protein MinD [Clostridiales Family XIII bacterium]